jgi:hypothetical protein
MIVEGANVLLKKKRKSPELPWYRLVLADVGGIRRGFAKRGQHEQKV